MAATKKMRKRVVEVNGEKFFDFQRVSVSAEEHMRNLRRMPMRQDDIIIAAFPKCGTHWLWEVVHMLTLGKVEYETRAKEHLMLEFVDVGTITDETSPRIINSHLFLRLLSEEIVTKRLRVVHMIRNPKDTAVSLYFHRRQRSSIFCRPDFGDEGILPFVEEFLQGGELPGNCHSDYFAYMREMERWQMEHPEVPFINIYYEDMKRDPVEWIKALAGFLDVEASDEFCEQIADACSFHKLKAADESVKTWPPHSHTEGANPTETEKESAKATPAPTQTKEEKGGSNAAQEEKEKAKSDPTKADEKATTLPMPESGAAEGAVNAQHGTTSESSSSSQGDTADPSHQDPGKFKKLALYRKGEVGDWKNHLTVALNEKFDDVIEEKLKDCVYAKPLRYTL